MQPADLAQRLASLDWSATSLQHQLAVSAAVETLGGSEALECHQTFPDAQEMFKPGEFKTQVVVPVSAEVFAGLGGVIRTEAPNNVVALPVAPRTRWTRLYHLDGTLWLSSCHFGPEGAWGWVLESVAAEHGVDEDQISSLEGEDSQYDGDDLVTIDGVPAYRLRHVAK